MLHARHLIALCLAATTLAAGCGNHQRSRRFSTTTAGASAAPASSSASPATSAAGGATPAPTSSGATTQPGGTTAQSGGATVAGVTTSVGATAATSSATSSASSVGGAGPGVSPSGCVNPGDDHGEDWSTGTAADLRSPFAGAIEVPCDGDGFVVFLRAGTPYELATETQGDTTLTVLDAVGFPVAFNDNADQNTLASRVRGFVPSSDGDYLVLVHTFSGAQVDYTLRVFPTGVLQMPRLDTAELYDTDGSRTATQGDILILTYTERLSANTRLGSPTVGSELSLTIPGDDLGLGATLAQGARDDQVRVVLGQNPSLTVAGVYDGTLRAPGAPSGVDVSFLARLSASVTGFPPARWAVDLTWGVGAPPP